MPDNKKYDHPALQQLYEYWLSKFEDGKIPGRSDVDPLDFPKILPHICLIDVERTDGRLQFRFRLFGTHHQEFNQQDFTGKTIDEVFPPDAAAKVNAAYTHVVETAEPHYWREDLAFEGRKHIGYERLICPLASDGETVDMLIGAFVFGSKKRGLS